MAHVAVTPPGMTRRRVLGLAAGFGAAAFLGACGGGSSEAKAPPSTDLTKNLGKVSLLTWETYSDDPWIQEYSQKTGVKVTAVRVGSGDEMFTKAQSGTVDADMIYIDRALFKRFAEAGLIAPAVPSRVPNADLITPGLGGNDANAYNGQIYGIPYNWGTQPLMYNADVVKTPPSSWSALWDPQFKGKVVMFDAADVTIPMVALYAGAKDPYNLGDEDFEKVRDALSRLRPQVRTIAKGFDDAVNIFASGDGVIGYCQNISEVTELNKGGKNFAYSLPDEGVVEWNDCAVLTPAGQRQEVYDYINATLALPWQARFIQSSANNGILTIPDATKAGVPQDVLKTTNIPEQANPSFWQKMKPMKAPESAGQRLEVWNEFKAGA